MPERSKPSSPKSGGRFGRPQGDGRKDPEQIKRNQEHLGVGGDHKTADMKKNRRGTFP